MILAFKKKRRLANHKRWKLPAIKRPESKDVFLFGGIASAGYGIWQIYPPSAYILVGGCFIALGLMIYMGGKNEGS